MHECSCGACSDGACLMCPEICPTWVTAMADGGQHKGGLSARLCCCACVWCLQKFDEVVMAIVLYQVCLHVGQLKTVRGHSDLAAKSVTLAAACCEAHVKREMQNDHCWNHMCEQIPAESRRSLRVTSVSSRDPACQPRMSHQAASRTVGPRIMLVHAVLVQQAVEPGRSGRTPGFWSR